jgi:hypothetical protein
MLYECTFMPFSVVEWIKVDVFDSYQVMADGFYTFERLEYGKSLSYSQKRWMIYCYFADNSGGFGH